MKVNNSPSPAGPASANRSTNQKSWLAWRSSASSAPSSSGVYWFLDAANRILYVGKAKNLKKRLSQYTQLQRLAPKIHRLVTQAKQVKWQVLGSEFEALLIEAELIRLHQPLYNSLLKDDKTPIYLHITADIYPKVVTVRKNDVDHLQLAGTILGPFPSASKLKEVLQIVRPIFPWCNQAGHYHQSRPATQSSKSACLYYHLDQCPGACLGLVSPSEYRQTINQLITFLRGKTKAVLTQLNHQLEQAAQDQDYELAAKLRDRIQLIKVVTQNQYRLKPTLVLPRLTGHLRHQSLLHLQKILSTYLKIPKSYPLQRIEGYDVSNTSGQLASVSMVVFTAGQPDKNQYRLFNIRSLQTPNDYQMIKEAVSRRWAHSEWGKPDLIVIDGGKGQLRAALQTKLALPAAEQWPTIIISIAKNPDRLILPVSIDKNPRTHRLSIQYQVVNLPTDHPTLHLIQHIRDESHRFSKRQHSRRRLKNMFK